MEKAIFLPDRQVAAATVEIVEDVAEVEDDGEVEDEVEGAAHLNKKTPNLVKTRAR